MSETTKSFFWPGFFLFIGFGAWATSFAGLAMITSTSLPVAYPNLSIYWFHILVYICIISGITYWFYSDSSKYPRITLLAFLASTLSLLINDLYLYAIYVYTIIDKLTSTTANTGGLLSLIGNALLLFVWIYWMLYVGLGHSGKARRYKKQKIIMSEEIEDLV
jgi:hypothetical protein